MTFVSPRLAPRSVRFSAAKEKSDSNKVQLYDASAMQESGMEVRGEAGGYNGKAGSVEWESWE